MTRLRISLALLICLAVSAADGQDRTDPRVNREFDKEVTKTAVEIMKYADANGDGHLSHPETINARTQVTEAMTDRLPNYGYIAGGEITLRGMRQKISQQSIDRNADRTVDSKELADFIGFAIAAREKAVRTPWDVQYRLTMEETADDVMKYTWALEKERRIKDNYKWKRIASQQRKRTWFEIQARQRAMRAEADLEIAKARRAADRDALLREHSPGLLPGEETQPATPPQRP